MKKFWRITAVLLLILVLAFGGGIYAKKPASQINVALVLKNLTNPFFVDMKYGGEAAANKYKVKFTCLAPERGDVESQIRNIEDLIQKGVDIIVVVPIDSQGIVSGIERANKANIPIIVANTKANGGQFLSWAGIDSVAQARAMGQYLVRVLKGKGKIVQLEGQTGAQTSIDRKIGFTEVFSKAKGIEVLASTPADYDKATAMKVTEDLLVRFPKIDAVVCFNDSMALGAVEALKAAGRLKETIVTGCDANQDALDSIRKGELTASVDSDPFSQAFYSVEAAIKYVKDGTVPPKLIVIGQGKATVVDKGNLVKFETSLQEKLKKYNIITK